MTKMKQRFFIWLFVAFIADITPTGIFIYILKYKHLTSISFFLMLIFSAIFMALAQVPLFNFVYTDWKKREFISETEEYWTFWMAFHGFIGPLFYYYKYYKKSALIKNQTKKVKGRDFYQGSNLVELTKKFFYLLWNPFSYCKYIKEKEKQEDLE